MELLFQLKENGSLPAISAQLGKHVRTNSESLIGVRMPGYPEDLSQGIAIGSGIYIDEHTHIEAVRYPSGSDAMGLLTTILTNGRPGPQRIALWLKNVVGSLLRHPFKTVRVLQPLGWAREFVILLCMQALDGEIEMRWQRPWFWPFRKFLVSRGEKVPTYIPKANEFAQKFAQLDRRRSHEHASGDSLRCSGHGALHRRLRDRRFCRPTAWWIHAIAFSATRTCTSATDRWWRPTSASIPA